MLKVWWTTKTSQNGFSAVEALLAATVFAFLVTGLIGAIIYGRGATADAGTHNRAVHLAEEGIEATRNIANAAYTNLTNGTFGIVQSGGVWTLSGTSDASDIYTRQVTVSDAGSNRKQITSVVSWTSNGNTSNVTLTSRVSNWESSIKSWANGILAGGANLAGTVDGLKVATAGNYAYVVRASGASNFSIVDVSNPAVPAITGNLSLSGAPTNIAISGNYAYVTNSADATELQVVNISNPASPTLATSLDLAGTANAVGAYVSGGYLYVTRAFSSTTNSFELTVLNLSNPASPTITGGYNHASLGLNEVYVYNNYAYVTTTATNPMMLSINATTPASPSLVGSYAPAFTLNSAPTIAGFGSTVYIGYGTTLDSVSVATPSAPVRLGTTPIGLLSVITDVDVDSSGQNVFIGTNYNSGEFMIYNISNPASMTSVKTFDLTGNPGTLNGVAYNATLDIVVGASISDTQELQTFIKN